MNRSEKGLFPGSLLRLLLLFCVSLSVSGAGEPPASAKGSDSNAAPEHLIFGVPMETDLVLNRKGFSLGYSPKYRQALWVSYILSAEQLSGQKQKRAGAFKVDPAVKFNPVRPKDYSRSGYDRGHLAPAGDMVYSVETMKHSFFMTNISPQIPGCNRGIWKRLEEQVRRWALKEKQLCVITGPVFSSGEKQKTMGNGNIPVPEAFYKVILDMTPPMKMIGFIVPNKTSKQRIAAFVVSVDYVEQVTGYDFFSVLDDELENSLEKHSDLSLWEDPGDANRRKIHRDRAPETGGKKNAPALPSSPVDRPLSPRDGK